MTTLYTLEDVKKHNDSNSIWIILDNSVYDITPFLHDHPGGEEVLLDRAGGDGTDCFDSIGHSKEAKERKELYKIGEIVESQRKVKVVPEEEDEYQACMRRNQSTLKDKVIPVVVVVFAFYFFFFVL